MELHPLSKSQKSIWDMERYYGGSIANITGAAFLSEPSEMGALQTAINKTVEQNDALRIRVKIQDGIPMQYIAAYIGREFETLGFDEMGDFEKWVNGLARKPFDISGELYEFYIVNVDERVGFVFHLHHLTADAWTLSILANNVLKNLKSEHVRINSYFEFIYAQREYENSARSKRDRDYFLSNFEKCREPAYFCDKQSSSAESQRMSQTLNANDTIRIKSFCADNSISPFSLFMNALAIYLYRIKGPQDFYIGTTVLNRTGRREKETAGIYINTVPVLFHVDESKSAIENIADNTNSIAEVFRHRKYQYGDLLKDIREKHNFSGRLYDITLNYQNAVLPDGIESSEWHFCGCQSESLTIHISDRQSKGEFRLDYDYQTGLFSEQDMERLHGHLITLISDIIENPAKKPHELKLLTDGEYRQVVFAFNDTAVEYPKDKCIHQLFEEQAERSPEAVAVVFEGVEYTYRQIDEMSNSLAHLLRDKGVGRNDIVAIIAKRSYKIIVAQLAILKAGGAYLPIDPNYPKERIAYMLGDAKCKAALTLGAEVDGIDAIDMSDESVFSGDCVSVESINDPEDLCALIYTSGSTGFPKGSMLAHKGLVNFCNHNGVIDKHDISICINSISFDYFIAETLVFLLYGSKLYITNENQQHYQKVFNNLVYNSKSINVLQTTPTILQLLLENEDNREYLHCLEKITLSGEPLTKEFYELLTALTKAKIFNTCGPTECSVWVCGHEQSTADITIGKPIANTQIYILDKYKNPLPIGAAGELCISGDGVGLGYLNRPELTAEKFVPNPFVEGKRMYKTGDLARWREDGNIEYIGRMDNQVKIRGLRIELGEIEAAIAKFEGIKQAAVVERKDGGGRQYICAYYISGGAVDEKALRAQLAKTLPRYMIPHFFTRLDVFPTTPSGKTDRKSFPAPDFSQSQSSADYAAPATEREKILVQILETVLGISSIGTGDDFFDLGGDSLKAIEFVSKAQHEGIHIELQNIYECPTIALLAGQTSARDCKPTPYHPEDLTAINKAHKA